VYKVSYMAKTTIITALAIVLASAALSVSCGEKPAGPLTGPTQSVPQIATLSGLVFEGTPQGDRPLGGVKLEIHALLGFTSLGTVSSDAEGRYVFGNVPRGTTVALARVSGILEQQCVASTTVQTDTVLDVELGEAHPSTRLLRSPIVSGVIFENTPAGRRPIPNAPVSYDWDCLDGAAEASTRSDANGRYEICRLPRGGCVDVFLQDGRTASRLIDVQRDTVLDIEVAARVTSQTTAGR
jgi:hypothetical protein